MENQEKTVKAISGIIALLCKIFGHRHLDKIDDGDGYYDVMWTEECLRCGHDYREEPEDFWYGA